MGQLPNIFTKITDIVPLACKYHLRYTPQFVQKPVITSLLNHIFSQFLRDDELSFLEGAVLTICIKDIDYLLDISVRQQQIVLLNHEQTADVTFTANFNELILLIARYEDPDTLFFHRRLSIEGDTVMGLEVKNWLDSLEMDILPGWCQQFVLFYADTIQKTHLPKSSGSAPRII